MSTDMHEKALRINRFVPESARAILDCACGDGARAAALKARRECWVTGIEKDPALAAKARGVLDLVHVGDQYDFAMPWDGRRFDVAIADDLLPRLREPSSILSQAFNMLTPGGCFLATAPNIQFYEHFLMLARGRWQYGGEGALAPQHLRFFTAQSLMALLLSIGFMNVRVGILDEVSADAFPLDATGRVRLEDIEVGPMSPEHHRAFLVREYLVVATKPS